MAASTLSPLSNATLQLAQYFSIEKHISDRDKVVSYCKAVNTLLESRGNTYTRSREIPECSINSLPWVDEGY